MNHYKWVAWGDSLTYGYGLLESQKWTSIVGNKFGVDICNFGVSGSTSVEAAETLTNIIEMKPELVFLNFGTNDATRNSSGNYKTELNVFHTTMNNYVQALSKHGIRVFLITPHHVIEGDKDHFYLSRHHQGGYNEQITPNGDIKRFVDSVKEIALLNSALCIDLYNDETMQEVEKTLMLENNDGVHYSSYGATYVASQVIKILNKEKIQ